MSSSSPSSAASAAAPAETSVAAPGAGPSRRRYAGASGPERQAQRQERLIDAAFDVFGRTGFRQTTLRLICAQARLNDRYFYEHFATLDDIFMAVHKKLSAEVAMKIWSGVMLQPDDPISQTRAGLTVFFEYIREDARRAQILLIDAIITGLASPHNLNARVSNYVDILKPRFRKRYPGLNIPLDVELVVGGFVGMIIHTATVWVERGFDTPVDTLVDHNIYAWAGLHHWLSAHSEVGEAQAQVGLASAGRNLAA